MAIDNAAHMGESGINISEAVDEGTEEGNAPENSSIDDPLRPLNVVAFHLNDKLYLCVLYPLSRGYAYILPETIRTGVGGNHGIN